LFTLLPPLWLLFIMITFNDKVCEQIISSDKRKTVGEKDERELTAELADLPALGIPLGATG
uniref:Uncharacterized protein n=1 Tax=Scleropages formosus TaxID=113540 RepID=A0A8C9T5V8_SCLFO